MPYRGVQQHRQHLQTTDIMRQVGFTATWRQYISASAGVSVAGFGGASSYREQVVTAILGGLAAPGKVGGTVGVNMQRQAAGGQLTDGNLSIVTNVQMGDKDEFIWRNVRYRVDANSQPSIMNGFWMTVINRGNN